ncbi:MAG TPA: cyclase family protein [Candidatus Brocadiia bacterium]|nr:cyclase family protein [Planctomycetota bacterium]MDO8094625.1 cyclase family protein [Candidatus Brocadiales bacterium]
MKIYDISVTISDKLPVWPGDPAVSIKRRLSIEKGDSYNISELSLSTHTGTHIDAPYHFEQNGLKVDELPLDVLIGRARVFAFAVKERIDLPDVKALNLSGIERVIFKTINSRYWGFPDFKKDFVYITPMAAQFLVDCGIRLVGIDYLSVEQYGSPTADVHHIFLRKGVIIIEGLDLRIVEPGDYELIALPLKIKDGDGSPARVILREYD